MIRESSWLVRGSRLLEEVQLEGLESDMITYRAVICACEKGKQPDKALELLEDMQWRGLETNVITYNVDQRMREGHAAGQGLGAPR